MGAGWQDRAGLVVTVADGSAPNPEAFSNLFRELVAAGRAAADPAPRPAAQLRHQRRWPLACRSRSCRSGSATPTSRSRSRSTPT